MSMGKKKTETTKKKGMALSNKSLKNVGGGVWYLYVRWADVIFRRRPRGSALACDHRDYVSDSAYWVEGRDYKLIYRPMGIGEKDVL